MAKRILVMGLPGSGKTTLAQELLSILSRTHLVFWYNADDVRRLHNDWDFSPEGRLRQSVRMKELADRHQSGYVICDFVAPYPEMREKFKADYTVWLDTIQESIYDDTNKLFVNPDNVDIRVSTKDSKKWAAIIAARLLNN